MNHYLELWPAAAFAAKRTAPVEKVRVEDLKRKLFA
jgi:hypothetical protein